MSPFPQLVLFLALIVARAHAQHAMADHEMSSQAPSAWHEFSMAGAKSVYLSHLPMFSSIHAYQVILEVQLLKADSTSANELFFTERAQHPATDFSLSPGTKAQGRSDFILPEVLKSKSDFIAYVHRSDPEKKDVLVVDGVLVKIKRIVYFHRFELWDVKPVELTYFAFGTEGDVLLAHRISGGGNPGPADFDQIIGIQTSSIPLKEGDAIKFPNRSNSDAERLQPGQEVEGTLVRDGKNFPLKIHLREEFHHEAALERQG